jgi:hypothetical protein
VTDRVNNSVNIRGSEIFGCLGDHESSKSRTSSFTDFDATVLSVIHKQFYFVCTQAGIYSIKMAEVSDSCERFHGG